MLDGVNANTQIGTNNYTKEALAIEKDSKKASLFDRLDLGDGNKDGYLTEDQYQMLKTILNPKYQGKTSLENTAEKYLELVDEKNALIQQAISEAIIEEDIKPAKPQFGA